MVVARRPLTVNGSVVAVGSPLDLTVFIKSRIRQMYEQRLIEPAVAPKGSRQMGRQSIKPVPQMSAAMSTGAAAGAVIPDLDIPVSTESYTPARKVPSKSKGARS